MEGGVSADSVTGPMDCARGDDAGEEGGIALRPVVAAAGTELDGGRDLGSAPNSSIQTIRVSSGRPRASRSLIEVGADRSVMDKRRFLRALKWHGYPSEAFRKLN